MHFVRSTRGVLAILLLGSACALAAPDSKEVASAVPLPTPSADNPRTVRPAPGKVAPTYDIQVGLEGEIYPVFANYASLQKREDRRWGTIAVTITNSTSRPLRNRVTVEVPGWSDQEIQMVEMGPGTKRTFVFAPTFLARLFRNTELTAATALVNVSDLGGRSLHTATAPVRLRSVLDMYWGTEFKYAQFIASWVTPHDAQVERVLSRAKEYMPGRRLPGYENGKSEALQEKSTMRQAKAIYRALQQKGVSYVKSSSTFGGNAGWSERVRLPGQALRQNSANCIDGVLLYASLFENLDMDPVVVIVPGHAYVGVRLTRHSKRYLYIETSLTGRAGFEAAVKAAQKGLAGIPQSRMTFVRIGDARRSGIYPMPQ